MGVLRKRCPALELAPERTSGLHAARESLAAGSQKHGGTSCLAEMTPSAAGCRIQQVAVNRNPILRDLQRVGAQGFGARPYRLELLARARRQGVNFLTCY
jgi:hypothetical protein